MLLRTSTALVGLAVLFAVLWAGLPWVFLVALLAAVLGIREFYRLHPPLLLQAPDEPMLPEDVHGGVVEPPTTVLRPAQDERVAPEHADGGAAATPLPTLVGAVWVAAFIIGGAAASGLLNFGAISLGVFLVGAFVALLWLISFYHGSRWPVATAYLMGGPLYVGFLLAHVVALAQVGEVFFKANPLAFEAAINPDTYSLGRNWLVFALLTTFATDTGAYLVGRAMGRRPLAPNISPNKTWEGAAGGFLGAVIAALLLERFLNLSVGPSGWGADWTSAWNWQPLVIGATVGIVAQLGDLLESKLKRLSQVKDAGVLMPGHGGLLDRLDSLLVTIPTVYYLLLITNYSFS